MSKIFYVGSDEKVYGPETESVVQGWYASGYLSSDVKFQVSFSDQFNPKERMLSLGELVELNGRTLPFYFSKEKENREKQQEETINQLKQDFESMRTSFAEKQSKDISIVNEKINVLQSQIASLRESHADHLKKLNELLAKKESSPENSQLEKKMTEIKKKVEEQEKSLTSMKKEISAINSKCDRNDAKMEKLIEQQKDTEFAVNGYSQQIEDLKSSEENIRSSITSCEQNVESTSTQLQSVLSDLSEMKDEMNDAKNGSTERATQFENLKKALTNVLDVVDGHEKLIKSVESAQQSCKLLEEAPNVPPWDKLKTEKPSDSDMKNKEVMPWEDNEKSSGSAASNQPEPWNECREEKTKGSRVAAKTEIAANEYQKENKTEPKPAKIEKATAEVKPVSRAKNWDAICRDLTDSEEEEEEEAEAIPEHVEQTLTPEEAVQTAAVFATDSIGLLSMYCSALDSGNYSLLTLREYPIEKMIAFNAALSPNFPCFENIKGTLRDKLRHLSAMPLYCHPCKFLLASPFHIFIHFIDSEHVNRRVGQLAKFNKLYDTMNIFIREIFYNFIGSPEQPIFQDTKNSELRLVERGRVFTKITPRFPSRLRPTEQFKEQIMQEVAAGITLSIDVPSEALANERPQNFDVAMRMKAIGAQLRTFLSRGNNKRKLSADFEKHLSEGVAGCSKCNVAYENVDEYYQHMTSIGHALHDQSFFTAFMVLWKGLDYWNTMV